MWQSNAILMDFYPEEVAFEYFLKTFVWKRLPGLSCPVPQVQFLLVGNTFFLLLRGVEGAEEFLLCIEALVLDAG